MKNKSNPLLLKFGKQVRKFRLSKNLSQEDLADLADLHWTYISGIERGIRNISLKNIEKISKALEVKLKDLLDF
jgi:transcriptional regulator with XRE-family HTH domain